jgi:hypothetical protein
MPLNYQELAAIAKAPDFIARIQYAICKAAVDVSSESTNTPGHEKRAACAQRMLTGSYSWDYVCLAVITNPSIAAGATAVPTDGNGYNIPDGDIQFTVNSMWNAFSGV